ncbi:halocarboxylic acid dehydrogenase DehI family protein [Candidatus Laterigemmans baculatus]|uniref:halocarboxylic acid dehydrogenase DehI family protein n=1 Tax=Candidatus Laterigemmans baculatus TaxID=2770505 RepID=UPI0013DB77E1|nr:halocarboxylic acid dehydrogenase DehI family protein [Candidatus Laterigemmans baculatus]
MFGFEKPSPVAEHEAEGEIERVYHEIRQTLRVTGVNLIFRHWASHKGLLPVIWDAMRLNAETQIFEHAADQLRTEAVRAIGSLGRLGATSEIALGDSQQYQIRAALTMYHYINPKLLLFAAAVRLGLEGNANTHAPPASAIGTVELGFPPRMYAMEMEDPEPDDERLRKIFADIQQTLKLESINSDYRTLALWPDYLAAVWKQLKPVVQRPEYDAATSLLRESARTLAAALPFPVHLSRDSVESSGGSFDKAVESTEAFEMLLPGLILNVTFCLQDWHDGETLARSPFPAPTRAGGSQQTPRNR